MSAPPTPAEMVETLCAARDLSTVRLNADLTNELLASYGLDDLALQTFALHVEHNAPAGHPIGAAFCGGFLLALELSRMRGPL